MCLESFDEEIDCLFKKYQTRLSSFKKWIGKPSPDMLASSGFYYTSIEDVCKCFYCGVEIFQWTSYDCPIIEHYRLSKNCEFAECLWYSKYKTNESVSCNTSPIIFKIDPIIVVLCIVLTMVKIFLAI